MADAKKLAAAIRDLPALHAKRDLQLVKALGPVGDGDDGALIAHGDEWIVLCGEAMLPSYVAAQPRAAGASAVVTNVSDVRAMGGRPLAILDMLVSPDEAHAQLVLEGLAWAAELLGVEVVGGHLTIGGAASLSATCTGIARRPLRAAAARSGDVLLAAFCLEGRYTSDDHDFFSSLRDRAPDRLRSDGDALTEVAEQGLCHAARDVSMPGAAGSLLQLLEAAGCGAVLDVDRLPRPDGVEIERWLRTFPSFGFLLATTAEHAEAARNVFTQRGLACEICGAFEDTRRLDLESGAERATVWDFDIAPLTGLGGGEPEVDRHRLVGDAEHRGGVAVEAPAEPLEEAHVRHLDLRDHAPAAELAGGADGEAHEHRAELRRTLGRQDGQPVALPQPVAVERVEAHGADHLLAGERDRVLRRGMLVAGVVVVVLEDPLHLDEHLPPDREVALELGRVARDRAAERGRLAVVRKR